MKKFSYILVCVVLLSSMMACGFSMEKGITISLGKNNNLNSIDKEPPVVTVRSGENQIAATLGTYTWTYDNGDGTRTSVCADSSHPLEWKEFLTPLITTQGTMELGFAAEPQKYTIRRWSDENWGKTDVAEEIVNVDNHTIELKQGGYIYEIVAEWTDEKLGEKNTVYYGFYVVFDMDQVVYEGNLLGTVS